jgi:hypothetical protein
MLPWDLLGTGDFPEGRWSWTLLRRYTGKRSQRGTSCLKVGIIDGLEWSVRERRYPSAGKWEPPECFPIRKSQLDLYSANSPGRSGTGKKAGGAPGER